jgi:predicted nuclease of predicted toxin-antitoxin system
VRFLIDNQFPAALARFPSDAGSECQHVLDVGLGQASDSEIWHYAAERQLVLISKDEDFFHRAARPGALVQLVWVRLGNCRKQRLLTAIAGTWPGVWACLENGDRIVEIR